jgi:hypothetical protein
MSPGTQPAQFFLNSFCGFASGKKALDWRGDGDRVGTSFHTRSTRELISRVVTMARPTGTPTRALKRITSEGGKILLNSLI